MSLRVDGATIFALSSGAPPAGVAVVRISGPHAGTSLAALAGALPPPRRFVSRRLHDAAGALLDHAAVLWLPGPGTVTGEDMAELHLHGGRAIVAAVQQELADMTGVRSAEPGEFTRRALLNRKLDLTSAEGLADLLAAETELQRRQALALAEGGLAQRIGAWRAELLALSAMVEAAIEFEEEERDVAGLDAGFHIRLDALRRALETALREPPAERLRDGFRVVVAGPPNAGKSALVNALAARDVAIVSAIAGTTRDLLEAPIVLAGMPIILIDSAGLRESADAVERIGVMRAERAIERSDVILWLGSVPEAPKGALLVRSKVDQGDVPAPGQIGVSSMTAEGLPELTNAIVARCRALTPADHVALSLRHRELVAEALDCLGDASGPDLLIVAEALRRMRGCFDRIVGYADVEAVLDTLFARFCIGK